MLGFPCSLFSRGSFLSRSLSSSTRSIFSITCGAECRGWSGLGLYVIPLRLAPSSLAPPVPAFS